MDWIIWLVVIVAIVAIVWWLLNRNSSRGSSGPAGTGTTDTGTADKSAPPHVHDAGHEASHRGALSGGGAAASASAAAETGMPAAAGFSHAEPEPEPDRTATPSRDADAAVAGGNPEWETQWSETPPAEPHAALHPGPVHGAHGDHVKEDVTAGAGSAAPVHHPEYTEPHAPTLPGAESAAAEADVEVSTGSEATGGTGLHGRTGEGLTAEPSTPPAQEPLPSQELADAGHAGAHTDTGGAHARETTMPSAASETALGHTAEPAGHLAVDQPYGEGSAAPSADGSGPEGFTVKGNASSMTYHDDTSPAFEETRAEVWFLSAAHAEAAGFRPPRRTRQ